VLLAVLMAARRGVVLLAVLMAARRGVVLLAVLMAARRGHLKLLTSEHSQNSLKSQFQPMWLAAR
jgi:hypothetical protein